MWLSKLFLLHSFIKRKVLTSAWWRQLNGTQCFFFLIFHINLYVDHFSHWLLLIIISVKTSSEELFSNLKMWWCLKWQSCQSISPVLWLPTDGLHFPAYSVCVCKIPKEDLCGSDRRHAAEERRWDDSVHMNTRTHIEGCVFALCPCCCVMCLFTNIVSRTPDLWPLAEQQAPCWSSVLLTPSVSCDLYSTATVVTSTNTTVSTPAHNITVCTKATATFDTTAHNTTVSTMIGTICTTAHNKCQYCCYYDCQSCYCEH